jgi:RNA methyltransferase, TrmH family
VRRRSLRSADRAFVLEGAKVIGEALDAGVALEAVFAASGVDAVRPLLQRALDAGVRVHTLQPGLIDRVADTVTPQPVMAIAPWIDVPLETVRSGDFFLVCVDVRDPGNAGTLLRSAEAAGASAVLFCDGSVDVFNPKTVRASAGSLFHVSVVNGGSAEDVLRTLASWGVRTLGTTARDGTPYDAVDLRAPVAIVLGNEAQGLPDDLPLDELVTIPMAGSGESLNVGMAAAVLAFEVARQRRHDGTADARVARP